MSMLQAWFAKAEEDLPVESTARLTGRLYVVHHTLGLIRAVLYVALLTQLASISDRLDTLSADLRSLQAVVLQTRSVPPDHPHLGATP